MAVRPQAQPGPLTSDSPRPDVGALQSVAPPARAKLRAVLGSNVAAIASFSTSSRLQVA